MGLYSDPSPGFRRGSQKPQHF